MKNNKLLSIFLLASVATSIFAGALSLQKNKYSRSNADVTSYKTVYLYVPNAVANYDNPTNPEKQITWDIEENNVTIYKASTSSYVQMNKIQDHLFFYTLSNEDNVFYYKTTISSKPYFSPNGEYGSTFLYSEQSIDTSLLQMDYYGYASTKPRNAGRVGNWYNPASVMDTAAAYANAFIKVLGDDVCQLSGESDSLKIKEVWKGLKEFFNALPDLEQGKLTAADKDDDEYPLKDFAALYDYVYWKYGGEFDANSEFAGRGITPRQNSKSITSNMINNDYSNIIVTVSIGATSIAIVSLYFFIKKKKETK